jgi:guanylate kinase
MKLHKNGMMIVLSSPSGAGKTTLTKKIHENNSNFHISISHTTREPRPNEIDGRDYYFINKKTFDDLIIKKSFYEYALIFGNYYGTLKKPILEISSLGKNILFDIDWQGTQQLKKIKNLPLVTIFIIPPDIKALKNRLLQRSNNIKSIVEQRMSKFTEELSHWHEYNYVVVNDDLESCYNKILKIIESEKKGIKEIQNKTEIQRRINELVK